MKNNILLSKKILSTIVAVFITVLSFSQVPAKVRGVINQPNTNDVLMPVLGQKVFLSTIKSGVITDRGVVSTEVDGTYVFNLTLVTGSYLFYISTVDVNGDTIKLKATSWKVGLDVLANNFTAATITLSKYVPVNVAPTISIYTYSSIADTSTITLTIDTADTDGYITKLETYVDNNLVTTLTKLTAGTHTIYVKAYDNDGAVTTSNTINMNVTHISATGIEDINIEKTYFSNNILHLNKPQLVNVYSLSGSLVSSIKTSNTSIDLSNLSTGIYVVKTNELKLRIVKK